MGHLTRNSRGHLVRKGNGHLSLGGDCGGPATCPPDLASAYVLDDPPTAQDLSGCRSGTLWVDPDWGGVLMGSAVHCNWGYQPLYWWNNGYYDDGWVALGLNAAARKWVLTFYCRFDEETGEDIIWWRGEKLFDPAPYTPAGMYTRTDGLDMTATRSVS